MITEGLKNVAQGLRDKFSGGNVSNFVRNPRNATKEMSIFNRSGKWRNKDEANAKLFGAKKKVPGKVGSVDTAVYTKIAAGQTPKLKNKDSIADIAAKLLNFLTKTERDRKLHFELFNNFKKEHLDEDKERHEELVKALEKRRLQTEKIESETQEAKKQYEKSKEESDKVIKETKDKSSKESAEKEASEKAAKEAKDKAAKEAKDKAEKEVKDKTAKEAAEKAAKEAKDKAAKEAAEKAAKEAKDKAAKGKTKTEPITGTATPAPASPANVPNISTKGPTTTPAAGTTTTPAAGTTTPAAGSTTPAISGRPAGTTTGSAKPAEPVTQASPSVTPAPRTSITPSTALKVGAGVVAAGVTLSAAAKLSLKAEQGVSSAEDALQPNNDDKRVSKGEFLDKSIPKVGAATPDVSNSTSYGLFGINNIRSKGKDGKPISGTSTLDAFVKDNPQLNLPDPGSNLQPEITKKFNLAWWQISKQNPKQMLEAQLNFYKNKFERPAIESLNKGGISKEIANNPGVQVYLVDRRIAYGTALLDSAINYAKSAKTPEEFIQLIAEFDDSHLRVKDAQGKNIGIYGDKTTDEKYKELEKGLHNRIKTRTAAALSHVKDDTTSATTILNQIDRNTGVNLNQSSVQNNNMKQSESNTVLIDNTQTTIISKSKGKAPPVITQGNTPDAPMFQQLGY